VRGEGEGMRTTNAQFPTGAILYTIGGSCVWV